ncbi:family 2 glycosyl transferase [Nitzschia inconspicua]|uniref:Family 2 glycosyl transferase n=1 Tax=Nitzschia inconspicua TaxID=303405 RepID=A0A9K3Q5Q8_9STRA|nr:family 2 glycosyl transferase [Nitzschia inconspicua]
MVTQSSSFLTTAKKLLPSTDSILTRLLQWTKHVGENHTPVVEWGLAWTTVAVFTIRYIVDYIKLNRRMAVLRRHPEQWWCHPIPICTLAHTRAELNVPLIERWHRLTRALEEAVGTQRSFPTKSSGTITLLSKELLAWSDTEWITLVQSSLPVRREMSYIMRNLVTNDCNKAISMSCKTNASDGIPNDGALPFSEVIPILKRLWPRFLEFPLHIRHPNRSNDPFQIAVIVPMYKESIETIRKTLLCALSNCHGSPQDIQIIIVHADGAETTNDDGFELCESLKNQLSMSCPKNSTTATNPALGTTTWGGLEVIMLPSKSTCSTNGGRGRTLNAGIEHAQASILTFLHADTLVPDGWDVQIQEALFPSQSNNKNDGLQIFPQACAFIMGIDIDATRCWETPGLLCAQWQGILRCHCGLPYGDSVLSFTKSTLEYIGRYPEQPLMEDYEVMNWLRVRSMVLRDETNTPTEGLVLLKGQAKCSPRRWQKYGVAYTSLVNAVCIHRYNHLGVSAEELFDFYYKQPQQQGECGTLL